jgi:hypothetical protein
LREWAKTPDIDWVMMLGERPEKAIERFIITGGLKPCQDGYFYIFTYPPQDGLFHKFLSSTDDSKSQNQQAFLFQHTRLKYTGIYLFEALCKIAQFGKIAPLTRGAKPRSSTAWVSLRFSSRRGMIFSVAEPFFTSVGRFFYVALIVHKQDRICIRQRLHFCS